MKIKPTINLTNLHCEQVNLLAKFYPYSPLEILSVFRACGKSFDKTKEALDKENKGNNQ